MPEAGQTLSHYRLVEKIGQGGMGEVWRATDVRLDRDVALKFLPDAVTHDPARLDRFAREAKFLASLNHPGIATIHDVAAHEGSRFLVMELVPGQDLGQTLEAGPLPLAEALEVALQIARAVESAHSQGVVHRDLKPANVKRTDDGRVKVLDFGLAKVLAPDPTSGEPSVSMSPTLTSAGTVAGVILGTAAYMSPEQARGRTIDKRTDVWSFGVLLYELLTGDNPFRGDTVADSVGAIMHRDPDLDALPPGTPHAVRRLLRRCLARERANRFHDIADVRIELEEAIERPEAEAPPGTAPAPVVAPPSKLPWLALAVTLPVVAVAAWWLGAQDDARGKPPLRRFELAQAQEVDRVSLSPDGERVAYAVDDRVFIRALDSLEPRMVSSGDSPVAEIFWSPDGRSLGVCRRQGELERLDLDGGAPTTLAAQGQFTTDYAWHDDGYIYYTRFQSGIDRIPESGGAAEHLVDPHEDMLDYHGMVVLDGDRGFLTLPHLQNGEYRRIFHVRPGEEPRLVYESDSLMNGLVWSPSGHLLFQRDENPRGLWALPFDADRVEVAGAPFMVVADLGYASVSNDGALAYARSALLSGKRKQRIVRADRDGVETEAVGLDIYEGGWLSVSPDGSRVAVVAKGVGRPSTGKDDLWLIDLERGSSSRLTEGGVGESSVVWSADGRRLAYVAPSESEAEKKKVVAVRADGTGERETLFEADLMFVFALDRDWSRATFMSGSAGNPAGFDIFTQTVEDPSTLKRIVSGPLQDIAPALHPNGKWLAWVTGDFVSMETFVQPFPEGTGRWKASTDVGGFPFWSVDGTKLYYLARDENAETQRLMEVSFDDSGAAPVLGRPVELFTVELNASAVPDPAGGFLILKDVEPAEGEEKPETKGIVLVESWLSQHSD
jgi:serine/threonine-protein kinase